ncbi:WSC domain-containing protein [Xylaria sp. FL1777]|nr:WSC domain-containing protein [Xylaria sp. FL1777]
MLQQVPIPLLSLLLISTPILPQITALTTTNTTTTTTTSSPSPSPSTPSPTTALQIVNSSSSNYTYAGCWNETTGLSGTTGLRALGGPSEVLRGQMTVELCLDFCAHGSGQMHAYRLAGLEYSRECWCGDTLNSLSVRLPDAACDTPCDGANATACGGALRLSLYNSTAAVANKESSAGSGSGSWRVERAWRGAVLGTVVLGLGFAFGC